MIADASEAAVRSAKAADGGSKEKIGGGIIKERLDRGQFDECDITMKDLETIKKTILTTFVGFDHERVAYPADAAKEGQ
jgi:membrane-associated HD superfamily phosphohydrolase